MVSVHNSLLYQLVHVASISVLKALSEFNAGRFMFRPC